MGAGVGKGRPPFRLSGHAKTGPQEHPRTPNHADGQALNRTRRRRAITNTPAPTSSTRPPATAISIVDAPVTGRL